MSYIHVLAQDEIVTDKESQWYSFVGCPRFSKDDCLYQTMFKKPKRERLVKPVVEKDEEDVWLFEMFWKTYPHARKWKKEETYTHWQKQDKEQLIKWAKLYQYLIQYWIEEARYVPACERWTRDYVYSDTSVWQRLRAICEAMIKSEAPTDQKQWLATAFPEFDRRAMFREAREHMK